MSTNDGRSWMKGMKSSSMKWIKPEITRKKIFQGRNFRGTQNGSSRNSTIIALMAIIFIAVIYWSGSSNFEEDSSSSSSFKSAANLKQTTKKKDAAAVVTKDARDITKDYKRTTKQVTKDTNQINNKNGVKNKIDKNLSDFVYVNIPQAADGRDLAAAEPSTKLLKLNGAKYHPNCESYGNVPPSNFPSDGSPYDGRTMFTLVRHPYDRFMQSYHFYCWARRQYMAKILPLIWNEGQSITECQNDDNQLNQFAKRILQNFGDIDHTDQDCMFMRQSDYVVSIDVNRVFCTVPELKAFGKEHISPTAYKNFDYPNKFENNRLTQSTKDMVRRSYKKDFYLCPDWL